MWQVFLNDFQINDQLIGMHLDEPIEGLAGLPAIRTSQGINLGRNGTHDKWRRMVGRW